MYITGDLHGTVDYKKLFPSKFDSSKLTKSDYLIISGDFGGIWSGSENDKWIQNWLKKQPYTTLFIDGNHENFNLLNSYKTETWNGGKVHKIAKSIYHLMRGQVFVIDGIKIFTMGGATSIDKHMRVSGLSWWEEELPSNKEYDEALNNLDNNNWEVDLVITHTAPSDIIEKLGYTPKDESLNKFFDELKSKLTYRKWFFGHFHKDVDVDEKHILLYDRIIKL
jgi:DNA repair exonuclease SbcCD nuclease subunit